MSWPLPPAPAPPPPRRLRLAASASAGAGAGAGACASAGATGAGAAWPQQHRCTFAAWALGVFSGSAVPQCWPSRADAVVPVVAGAVSATPGLHPPPRRACRRSTYSRGAQGQARAARPRRGAFNLLRRGQRAASLHQPARASQCVCLIPPHVQSQH